MVEISDLERLLFMVSCDSISEEKDKEYFKKEYTTMSLEEQFERGLIDAVEYDSEVQLRDLREKGVLPNY